MKMFLKRKKRKTRKETHKEKTQIIVGFKTKRILQSPLKGERVIIVYRV
jgi:hypothetical protein